MYGGAILRKCLTAKNHHSVGVWLGSKYVSKMPCIKNRNCQCRLD